MKKDKPTWDDVLALQAWGDDIGAAFAAAEHIGGRIKINGKAVTEAEFRAMVKEARRKAEDPS